MSNQGKCPGCGKRVLHVNVENVIGMIGDESKGRCLSYTCLHCHCVLGVQIDPRAKPRARRKPAPTSSN